MSLKSIHSKDYQNLLNNIIENELSTDLPNNEVLWVAMGTELEIEGIPKPQISTIMRRDIEDMLYEKQFKEFMPREDYKWHNGTYWVVTKKNGWTNPDMARNVDPSRIKEIVPRTNPKMITTCYDLINICRILIDKSKEGTPFEDTFGEKQCNEFYLQMGTIINNCKNAIDNKTKVPENRELFLLECLATLSGSTNKCAEIFAEQNLIKLKEQGKFLTLKQATKFQKGGKQSQLYILKPIDRDTAIYSGYTGIHCTCNSWRVRETPEQDGLECYDCDKKISEQYISKCTHCHIPLYKERLLYMVNHNNKCKNCDEIVDLPQTLIAYAKS